MACPTLPPGRHGGGGHAPARPNPPASRPAWGEGGPGRPRPARLPRLRDPWVPPAGPGRGWRQSLPGGMTLVRSPSTRTSRIVSALFTRMSSQASGVWKALWGVTTSRPSSQGSRAR